VGINVRDYDKSDRPAGAEGDRAHREGVEAYRSLRARTPDV